MGVTAVEVKELRTVYVSDLEKGIVNLGVGGGTEVKPSTS
jgi:hypothetical protein